MGHGLGGSMGPVAGAEGVAHEYLRQGRVAPGQGFVVLGLAGEEAHVFQQQHLAGAKGVGLDLSNVQIGR